MLVTSELHDRTLHQNKCTLMTFVELTIIFNLIGHTGEFFSFIYSSRVIIFDGPEKWKRKKKVHALPECLGFKTCTLWL